MGSSPNEHGSSGGLGPHRGRESLDQDNSRGVWETDELNIMI